MVADHGHSQFRSGGAFLIEDARRIGSFATTVLGRRRRRAALVFALITAFIPMSLIAANRHELPAHLRGHYYNYARARLARLGYAPALMQHDQFDSCWIDNDARSYCRRYPEILECDIGSAYSCISIFSKPHASSRREKDRYIVVQSAGQVALVVYDIRPAEAGDLKTMWVRKDLARRGCLSETVIGFRDCDHPVVLTPQDLFPLPPPTHKGGPPKGTSLAPRRG